MKRLWEAWCLPALVDGVCRSPAILEERRRWVPRAAGEVLEVGIGSGLNLPLYDRSRVELVVGVDPSEPLLARARERARAVDVPVVLARAHAERLPFDAGRFTTAVVTFTLCSVTSPRAALAEVRRVLGPGGELIFLEHGLAPDPGPRRWQQRISPLWRHVSGNCHLDRDTLRELDGAGFVVDDLEAGYAGDGPRLLSFTTAGVATAPGGAGG